MMRDIAANQTQARPMCEGERRFVPGRRFASRNGEAREKREVERQPIKGGRIGLRGVS
jgi:hypothetical protein